MDNIDDPPACPRPAWTPAPLPTEREVEDAAVAAEIREALHLLRVHRPGLEEQRRNAETYRQRSS